IARGARTHRARKAVPVREVVPLSRAGAPEGPGKFGKIGRCDENVNIKWDGEFWKTFPIGQTVCVLRIDGTRLQDGGLNRCAALRDGSIWPADARRPRARLRRWRPRSSTADRTR